MVRLPRLALSLLLLALVLLVGRRAVAAPEAHILRIDPRAGMSGGAPVITTVIDVVRFNPLSDALAPCQGVRSYNDTLDCWSDSVKKDGALWSPFPFPKANAIFTVKVQGQDYPAKVEGEPVKWGDSKDPSTGTAWLVALDASNAMGARYQDAREVAHAFIEAMGPNDLMDLIIFDDRDTVWVRDSKWMGFKDRKKLVEILEQHATPSPSYGGNRSLFGIIKRMTRDAFGTLGNTSGQAIPLHQAMVLLSNGSARGDTGSMAPTADVFKQYLNKGRFPEDNTSLPKTPLPVISIWFPNPSGLQNDLYRNNESQFMQNLANVEIGGFFDIVRQGQGNIKDKDIVKAVKKRFNAMWIVKWRLSCMNPSIEQTFNLVFQKVTPMITGDGSFKDVPIGVDPTQWPLDVDVEKTKQEAEQNPVYPGGTVKIYGNFCWGGDKGRAEAYFIPAGTQPDPNMSTPDIETAKKAQQSLIAQNMRGEAIDVNEGFAVFKVPDEDKVVEGQGDARVARVLIYDNVAKRTSGHDPQTILTLKAKGKPLNWLLIGGGGGLLVVIVLVAIVLMRGGGGGGRKRTQPPPQPVIAGGPGVPPYGGGYGGPPPGAPPGGYGGPPPGAPPGGYGGPPPGGGYGGGPGYGAAPGGAQPNPPRASL